MQRWLASSLATHRRGTRLASALGAIPLDDAKPDAGLCLLSGQDFQRGDAEAWAGCSERQGRVLVLIPPFDVEHCQIPVSWSVAWRTPPHAEAPALLRLLAPEVKYSLDGKLGPAPLPGAEFADHTLATALHRRHPHAGALVITVLPLWSLALLDQEADLQAWVSDVEGLTAAGIPAESGQSVQDFVPRKEHFTVLLHLLSGPYADRDAALAALERSPIFAGAPPHATSLWSELESSGLLRGGALTDAGRSAIEQSPYSYFLEHMGGPR
jgi:hypothetical protein